MAIKYSDLVTMIQDLGVELQEKDDINNLPDYSKGSLVKPYQKIYSVLDSTTSKKEKSLPVVITVGSNYGQGLGALNNLISSNGKQPVEEILLPYRQKLEQLLDPLRAGLVVQDNDFYQQGHAKEVWTTGEGFNIYTNGNFREDHLFKGSTAVNTNWGHLPGDGDYHMVMTNFCPFITTLKWGDLRDKGDGVAETLLDYGIWLNHITALREKLGSNVILWIGHGNFDVYYRFFTYVIRGQSARYQSGRINKITRSSWLFTNNLSQSQNQCKNGFTVCV